MKEIYTTCKKKRNIFRTTFTGDLAPVLAKGLHIHI